MNSVSCTRIVLGYFETVHREIGVFVPSNFHSLATKTKLQLIVRNFDNSKYITWKILQIALPWWMS